MSGTGTQQQLTEAEVERRVKILNDIAKRVAEIQQGANKSISALMMVAEAVITGNETGHGVIENAEKLTATFVTQSHGPCAQQEQNWINASANAGKTGNWAPVDGAYRAYVDCLRTLRPLQP